MKRLAREIVGLPPEERNGLEVALSLLEEFAHPISGTHTVATPRRKPAPKPAPEAVNG